MQWLDEFMAGRIEAVDSLSGLCKIGIDQLFKDPY